MHYLLTSKNDYEYPVDTYLVCQHSDIGIFDSFIKLLSLTRLGHLFVQLAGLCNWSSWLTGLDSEAALLLIQMDVKRQLGQKAAQT